VGYIEGALTWKRIWQFWQNLQSVANNLILNNNSTLKGAIEMFVLNQQTWSFKMATEHPDDPVWAQVYLMDKQLQGMVAGYNSQADKDKLLTLFDLVMLNSFPDSMDIAGVVSHESRVDWYNIGKKEAYRLSKIRSHCSVLIKAVKASTPPEIFAGHTTWFAYSAMIRIYKHINLQFSGKAATVANPTISFSSYPASWDRRMITTPSETWLSSKPPTTYTTPLSMI